MEKKRALRLTESAIMLAFATILSMVKLVDLPYGGSITAFSMLPILLIAYRYGTGWGLFTAFAHSLLQLLLGMNDLSYATSAGAAVAIILLDYVVAFLVLGLGGIFRGKLRSQGAALAGGAILTGALRYICHVISGCTVWAGLSIPDSHALLYSLAYNATYMVPEILITVVGAVYLSKVLDFSSETITRTAPQAKAPDLAVLWSGIGKAALAVAVIFDILHVFASIQGEEGFDITGIAQANWPLLAIVTAVGALLFFLFGWLASRVPADSPVKLKGLFRALPFVGVAAAAVFDVVFIVLTVQGGELSSDSWVQMILLTVCVLAAAFFALFHDRTKRQA